MYIEVTWLPTETDSCAVYTAGHPACSILRGFYLNICPFVLQNITVPVHLWMPQNGALPPGGEDSEPPPPPSPATQLNDIDAYVSESRQQ